MDATVTVEQDGLPVWVSIDRITRMRRGPGNRTVPTAGTRAPSERIENPRENDTNAPQEFVFDRFVAHRDTPTGLENKVRWYGYIPVDDTYHPAEDLPQAFIDRY